MTTRWPSHAAVVKRPLRPEALAVCDRIKVLLAKFWHGNQSEMARVTGVPQSAIAKAVHRKCAIGRESLARICQTVNIDGTWLLTGQGPMIRGECRNDRIRSVLAALLAELGEGRT